MPERADDGDPVAEHVRSAETGLQEMLVEAQRTWQARAEAAGDRVSRPGWRAFEDAFPTFYQFTNRPR
jgi:hypothetical protein